MNGTRHDIDIALRQPNKIDLSVERNLSTLNYSHTIKKSVWSDIADGFSWYCKCCRCVVIRHSLLVSMLC